MTIVETSLPLNFLWLELTEKCNLFCEHCYNDSSPHKPLVNRMREEDWIDAISLGADQGVTDIQFIGGEPLLVKYIDRLIAFARSRSLRVEVFTNATGVTKRHIDLFREHDVSIATSFYSFDAETHDRITGKPGSWRRTVAALQMLVANKVPLRVGIIVMDANRDGYGRTREFLSNIGVTNCGTDNVRAFGRAEKKQLPDDNYFNELCGRCGTDRACITSSGDIFPCIMSRSTVVGNYFDAGLSLRNNELSDFRGRLQGAKNANSAVSACTPDCFPHGGCAPHDVCNPQKKLEVSESSAACTPDCWPHGGCAPHDVCNPQKKLEVSASAAACTPDCWPHGGCAPHDVCNPQKKVEVSESTTACTPDCWPHGGCAPHDVCNPHNKSTDLPAGDLFPH